MKGRALLLLVNDMLAQKVKVLHYKRGATYFYNIPTKTQTKIPGQDSFIILNNIHESKSGVIAVLLSQT
jgi:3-hydroxyacyl-CoA dehydrogenase